MICKMCNSTDIRTSTSIYTKSKNRSFIWNLFMIVLTGGFWLIWMLIRKRKEKVVRKVTATCQNCGHSWDI